MVSIITINYNGLQDTCDMIASFRSYESYPYEIIVVDNASQNNEAEQLCMLFPEITVVSSERNLGFAGGNNLGYRHAKGDYIFFLNNDMEICEPVLEKLVFRLQQPQVGGVSPMMRCFYPPHILLYYGYQRMTPITLRNPTPLYDASREASYYLPCQTEVMHGGAMMVRREVIDCVGEMTEAYFLFYEEFDWSYRITDAGYRLWYEPGATVYHKEGMTIGKSSPVREFYLSRARILFARRNNRGIDKYLSCLYLATLVLAKRALYYMFRGEWKMLRAALSGSFRGFWDSLSGSVEKR